MFWEETFTGEEKLFSAVNTKNCGCRSVRKKREIRGSDKYVTLDISLKFDSLYKMKIKSSESKEKLERSGKGLTTSLGLKAKVRPHNLKRQGMPSEMLVRKTFRRILRSLRNYLMKVMGERGQNMRKLTANFN